jgi:hypothetical protein
MDVKEYRKRYEAELAAAAATEAGSVVTLGAGARATGDDPRRSFRATLRTSLTDDFGDDVRQLLAALGNPAAPTSVRVAALQRLKAMAFLGAKFAPYHTEFLTALRKIVRPGSDPQLREAALEVLAAEKDPETQEMLRRGLQDPRSALVPPAKALQLLSYDDHANVSDLALNIFHQTDDLGVKEAALRVLGTDAKSQDLLAQLLQDKGQPASLRALSATGLHYLNPQRFANIARTIVMDDNESENIRATSLGALASVPNNHALRNDSGFLDRVEQLGTDNSLKDLSVAARRMMAKP